MPQERSLNRVGTRHYWRWMIPPLVDCLLFYVSLFTTIALRQPQLLTVETGLAFLPLFMTWIAVMYALGLYDLRLVRSSVSLIKNLLASSGACLALGTTYFYLLHSKSLTPKTHLLLTVMISHALILGWRRAWLMLLHYSFLDQRFVFLGDPADMAEIEKDIPHHAGETGLTIVPWQYPGVDMVVADSRWVDWNWEAARPVFLAAIERGVPIVTLEDFYESVFGKVSPHYAGRPSWALKFTLPNNIGPFLWIKRAFDASGSAALLIATAPILVATAALIALIDGRPIFYRQARAGFLGRPFMVLKFRTMSLGAETTGPFTSAKAHGASITRLGKILRRYRIDELPQLWNVLIGDMSLVGPRPEWVREVEVLEKVVPSYHLRHLVKPGITGWAQVKFRATNSIDDSIEKIHFDLYYLKYLSLGLDISILLQTVKRVLTHDSQVVARRSPALQPKQNVEHWAADLTAHLEHPRPS
ncbi:MAG: sugar transferase [Elusimicrobia bacterium]|nr:sugar transferase [Elusimicrobiota bacterium]